MSPPDTAQGSAGKIFERVSPVEDDVDVYLAHDRHSSLTADTTACVSVPGAWLQGVGQGRLSEIRADHNMRSP